MRNDLLPPPPPEALCQTLGINGVTIDWLAGDGSDRCYYRVRSSALESDYVLMQLSEADAKLLRNNGYDWVHLAELLQRFGVRTPKLRAKLPDFAALLIEDYGDWMLESEVRMRHENGLPPHPIYEQTLPILEAFLEIPRENAAVWCQRSFDQERFVWELNFFMTKYLEPVAGMTLSETERAQFQRDSAAISQVLSCDPQFFVHRDFHSRNLMLRNGELAVIDFQDARLGPPTYDLVSLVFDSYVPLGANDRRELLEKGLSTLGRHVDSAQLNEWPATLLQRQIKAIGSFGYLTLEKGRGDYLCYVKPALKILAEIPEIYDARWPFISGELLERLASIEDPSQCTNP